MARIKGIIKTVNLILASAQQFPDQVLLVYKLFHTAKQKKTSP